jgi:shikimate kinase/3-dehydroquinate synthase
MLREMIVKDNVIISTGGGTILKNEEILKKSYNILLHCELSVLIKRASRNKNRPLLSSNVENKMKDLFNERKDLYNKIADLKIDASTNITKTVKDILNSLES